MRSGETRPEMNYIQAAKVSSILIYIALALALLSYLFMNSNMSTLSVIVLIFALSSGIAGFIVIGLYYKCPHCKHRIRAYGKGLFARAEYCPICGGDL